MQWGKLASSTNAAIMLPLSYNDTDYAILLTTINSHQGIVSSTYENDSGGIKIKASFYLGFSSYSGGSRSGAYWFTIGY